MPLYLALIHKEADSSYGVSFPDFPGCITAVKNLDNVNQAARDALLFHIQGIAKDGQAIPECTSTEAALQAYPGAFKLLVDVPYNLKVRRIQITMEDRLLRDLDSMAEAAGYTRSGYLAHLVREAKDGQPRTS